MKNELQNSINDDEIIENFENLPVEERARLVARQEANEWAAIERMREENLKLEEKVKQLEALAAEQERIADAMEQLAERSRRIRAERETLMAA